MALAAVVMTANVMRNVIAVWGSYWASGTMHARLLGHVLLLPMSFFDSQPLGRLLNRFAKDTEVVDVELLKLVSAVACCTPHQAISIGFACGFWLACTFVHCAALC